jgi:Ca2+/H+ antiporter
MNRFEHWPLWLQLLIAIPNAIVMTILLWIWWPRKKEDVNRFSMIVGTYLLLIYLFYLFFGR